MTTCHHCGTDYVKVRKLQRFCSGLCRQAYHNSRKTLVGPQGLVKFVRKIKGGKTSITIHFDGDNAGRSLGLEIGDKVQVGECAEIHQAEPGQANSSTESRI